MMHEALNGKIRVECMHLGRAHRLDKSVGHFKGKCHGDDPNHENIARPTSGRKLRIGGMMIVTYTRYSF